MRNSKFNKVLGVLLLIGVTFSVVRIINAIHPNPGHSNTEIRGGEADIIGGTINNTTIGSTTPSTGRFTSIRDSSGADLIIFE